MTQVLQHDYGKSKVTLLQIRAAIKAVNAERLESERSGRKHKSITTRKANPSSPAKNHERA